MDKENRNNFSEQVKGFKPGEDFLELEDTYEKIFKFRKGETYKKKFKQSLRSKINLVKTNKEFQI